MSEDNEKNEEEMANYEDQEENSEIIEEGEEKQLDRDQDNSVSNLDNSSMESQDLEEDESEDNEEELLESGVQETLSEVNETDDEVAGKDLDEGTEEALESQLGEDLDSIDESEPLSEEEEAARIQRQLREFKRNQIEAALYASGKPLSIEIISTKLEIPKTEVEELLNELAFDYLDRSTALVIAQMGDRYQMQIKHEYSEKVSKFAEGGAIAEKYLRTLTIIALKQPIMKSLLVKIRGSGAYEHVKYLEDEGLIESKKKGRSSELMTTDKYAEMFGLPKDREEMKRMMIAQLNLEDQ